MDFSLVASTLLQYVKDDPWNIVSNIGIAFKKYEFNFGYQWNGGFSNSIMLDVDKITTFGYSYEYPKNSDMAPVTGVSHEILLKIHFGKQKIPKNEKTENIEEKPIIRN